MDDYTEHLEEEIATHLETIERLKIENVKLLEGLEELRTLATDTLEELKAEMRPYKDAMNEFCDRVEAGEIRSRHTYAKFKGILGR